MLYDVLCVSVEKDDLFSRTNQLFSGSEIRIYDCAIHVHHL